MPKRVMFALQKGGVGKTTSTAAVAEILAATGHRVLVVDFDSQGNATKILTGNSIYRYSGSTIMEAIEIGNATPYVVSVKENLDILPAEDHLATFSRYIYTSRVDRPYAVLKRLLEPLEASYDYVFVDVGPSLGDHFVNALVYADHIIVPVDLGELSMDAMIRFIEFVEETKKEGHTTADIIGILPTMRDGRSRHERENSEGIRAVYGDQVFRAEIRRRTKIKEMASSGVDIHDPSMEDYLTLTEEIIERTRGEDT